MANGLLFLDGHSPGGQTKILQLYRFVELLSEGDPPHNSLFILDRTTGAPDQLLIVDPPTDATKRFRLAEQVAAVFTGPSRPVGMPELQTLPDAIAHVRLGEQYVDVHPQRQGAVVHLPALGIVCSGRFGSVAKLPRLAEGSDGEDELETLLLLARLIRQGRFQLLIPQTGHTTAGKAEALGLLAVDVAYLHGLRRVVPPLAWRGDPLDEVQDAAATVTPPERRHAAALAVHRANVAHLYQLATRAAP